MKPVVYLHPSSLFESNHALFRVSCRVLCPCFGPGPVFCLFGPLPLSVSCLSHTVLVLFLSCACDILRACGVGVVWYGMVWYGCDVRCGVVMRLLCALVWWCLVVRCGVVWCDVVCSLLWCLVDMVWWCCVLLRYGVVWCGVVWFDWA